MKALAFPAGLQTTGQVLTDLLELILPETCASCGTPARRLCDECAATWRTAPLRVEEGAGRLDRMDGTGPLPVWALAVHRGPPRRAVVAWKDHGRVELTDWFASRMSTAAAVIAGQLGATESEPLLVVTAPPSRSGRRRRGEDVLQPLATAVRDGLNVVGIAAQKTTVLRAAGFRRDQVGLGLRARGANLSGRVRLRSRGFDRVSGARVLLVDDVLTTGATLAACRAAIEGGGGRVIGAMVLTAAPAPDTRSRQVEPCADQG